VEGVLSKDMATFSEYFQIWKLKLNTTKRVLAVFHLNIKETTREVKVNHNNEMLLFWSEPKDLGNTLGKSLKHRRHLDSLSKKSTSRVVPLRRLVESGWGALATRMKTTTLALVRSKAEYCAPLWCRSAHGHIHLTDRAINDALVIVTVRVLYTTGWERRSHTK